MADNQTTAAEPTNGRVTRVQGSVIDVEFPVGHLPDIYNALKVTIVNTSAKEEGEAKETEITLEAWFVVPPSPTPAPRSPCRSAT